MISYGYPGVRVQTLTMVVRTQSAEHQEPLRSRVCNSTGFAIIGAHGDDRADVADTKLDRFAGQLGPKSASALRTAAAAKR